MRLELDGMPLVHVPGQGSTGVRVLFRTGVADESLRERGWTHLVEHLSSGRIRSSTTR